MGTKNEDGVLYYWIAQGYTQKESVNSWETPYM